VHRYVEQMDKYYGNVCELDIIFNFQKAYFLLDELLLAGEMQESSKKNVLRCIAQQDSLEDMEVSESMTHGCPFSAPQPCGLYMLLYPMLTPFRWKRTWSPRSCSTVGSGHSSLLPLFLQALFLLAGDRRWTYIGVAAARPPQYYFGFEQEPGSRGRKA
jgi:hypothetical protein